MFYSIFKRLFIEIGRIIPEKLYLQCVYYSKMGKWLDLKHPKTMNEKLQWLKLYNRKAEMTDIVDKYTVKDIIAKRLGEEYIIPTLAAWDKVEDIDISNLPNQFVLKTNHSGGTLGCVICKDKATFDFEAAKKTLDKSMKAIGMERTVCEWPYKNVKRKIIAEKYMADSNGELNDYKFYCFDGHVDSVLVCIDRQKENEDTKFYFFDKDWQLRRYNKRGKAAPEGFTLPKPKNMDKMFEIASELSKGVPFLRVDLYNVDGDIYFGELTYYPDSGFDENRLPETDLYFGNLIKLPTDENK